MNIKIGNLPEFKSLNIRAIHLNNLIEISIIKEYLIGATIQSSMILSALPKYRWVKLTLRDNIKLMPARIYMLMLLPFKATSLVNLRKGSIRSK